MSDPAILFVKPNAIGPEDKTALRDAGVIVVEIDNPADAKFVRAGADFAELSGSHLLLAACDAIQASGISSVRAAFGEAVCAAIEATRPAKPEST